MTQDEIRDLCRRCREAVTAEEVARFYGLDISRQGKYHKALCVFHHEKTPSLVFFPDGKFKCFGCGAHGDVINYVSDYLGLSTMDAIRRLDADFNLHLPIDRQPTTQEASEARQRAEKAEAERLFRAWRERTQSALSAAYRAGYQALNADRELTEAEAYAVRNMDRIEHLLDTLSGQDLAAQYSIFRHWREVDKLCRTVLRTISDPT